MEANSTELKASVWMITYNHERYIAQAIESVLSQVTDFPFDLIIGEDCSTDNTRAICLTYQEKFPDIVKVLQHQNNVGIHNNLVLTLEACNGQYVAMLEGDDYWTDTLKLQKQVDFLDRHPDFVMSYMKTLQINEITGLQKINNEADKPVTGMEEILSRGWFMRTGSLVFRNGVLTDFPSWYFEYKSTDYMLHVLLAQHGKIGFLNEVTSVYRTHEGGITRSFETAQIEFYKKKLKLLDRIDDYLNFNYSAFLKIQKKDIYNSMFKMILRKPGNFRNMLFLTGVLPHLNYSKLSSSAWSFIKRRLS